MAQSVRKTKNWANIFWYSLLEMKEHNMGRMFRPKTEHGTLFKKSIFSPCCGGDNVPKSVVSPIHFGSVCESVACMSRLYLNI